MAIRKKSRREFLESIFKFLPMAAAASCVIPCYNFLSYNTKKITKVAVPLDKITSKVTLVKEIPAFIVKNKNGFEAFDAHCTHMGCILNYCKNDKLFECPCHGSAFELNGEKVHGPARKPLKRLAFRIKDGKLIIG